MRAFAGSEVLDTLESVKHDGTIATGNVVEGRLKCHDAKTQWDGESSRQVRHVASESESKTS